MSGSTESKYHHNQRPLVLSLNPAVDAEWFVDDVRWEEKNIINRERRWAGGKGVNVARWLKFLGASPELLLPLGGEPGNELKRHLDNEGLTAGVIDIHQSTRVDIIITTADARQLRFNPIGPELSGGEWNALYDEIEAELDNTTVQILSGSLPHGSGYCVYADLVKMAKAKNVKSLVDCDGPAFNAVVDAQPFLIKPNEFELEQWSGSGIRSDKDAIALASKLSEHTSGFVLLSRGPKGGLLVNASMGVSLSAAVPDIDVVNKVGAGDALLAATAFQVFNDSPPEEWLKWGMTAGNAAVSTPGGGLPDIRNLEELAALIRISNFRSAKAKD
ncbi:MAG: hexose kinase [Verrucomicrobia bacterium]|nr:hexose kinase [Verrucomicrobiota bacterium]